MRPIDHFAADRKHAGVGFGVERRDDRPGMGDLVLELERLAYDLYSAEVTETQSST
mgnify:CR=1 FL=1